MAWGPGPACGLLRRDRFRMRMRRVRQGARVSGGVAPSPLRAHPQDICGTKMRNFSQIVAEPGQPRICSAGKFSSSQNEKLAIAPVISAMPTMISKTPIDFSITPIHGLMRLIRLID